MRETLPAILRCPVCGVEGRWALDVSDRDEIEVREGSLLCEQCGSNRSIAGGIVDLLHDPPSFVVREAAGLERFVEFMRATGWDREKILQLPYVQDGYWYAQATAMHQTLHNWQLGLKESGGRILDIGANTCWASAMFAECGLDVIALDITTHEMQGLATADWWFADRGVHFDRVLGVMFELPVADASLDFVWCCGVLHHNHRDNLQRTLSEIHRVLKPGGRLIAVNEPVRALRAPRFKPGGEVAEFDGHEHAFLRATYVRDARRAGFDVELVAPWAETWFTEGDYVLRYETSVRAGFGYALAHLIRRWPLARKAVLAWQNYVSGTSAHFIATKRAE